MSARELALQRLLSAYISSGLLFLLLPGTFLGVWNLIAISEGHSATEVSPAWLQAHGHAQIFGWIGSFIIGIGFYSLSKMGGVQPFEIGRGWLCWGLWSSGVALRWIANLYGWQWRGMLPLSALLELTAFLIFFASVGRHKKSHLETARRSAGSKREIWMKLVLSSTLGFLVTLLANLALTIQLGIGGTAMALPHVADQRFLTLALWGFLALTIWGFSARWLPVFLGLRKPDEGMLLSGLVCVAAGVVPTSLGAGRLGGALLFIGAVCAAMGLHIFDFSERPSKTHGIHPSFSFFVRAAYFWMLVAAATNIWALVADRSGGIFGASRHALTVGFISTMVFSIGQRVLPAFCGMRTLFSPGLMFASLLALNIGCVLRVATEVSAYNNNAAAAWKALPVSAILEMAAVTLFALNLFLTLLSPPAHELRRREFQTLQTS
jgi:hypothetical protein